MSSARDGEWNLVGHDSDPVPATAEGLDGIISHYKDIAQAMTDQAALLKRIGDGDVRLLKGQSADALRKRARESNEALSKVADRYTDVKDALVGYQPELRTARTLTGEALDEAEAANRELGHADGMPDPVSEDRTEDDPLTDEDRTASSDRTAAIGKAESKIADAKDKSDRALEALRVAAERAAAKIKENWGDDGLHHSWQEALRHQIAKVLKKIVEILGYIGMALAVLAILIPGLGIVTLLGVVVTVLSVVASTILAAWGEGSWLSVIIGVVGIAFIGVGAIATKALKGLQSIKVGARGGGWRDSAVDRLAAISRLREGLRIRLPPNFSRPGAYPRINFSRPMPAWRANPLSPAERSLLGSLDRQFAQITQNLNRWDDFIGGTTVKPPFWQFYTKNFWSVEKSRFGDVLGGNWRGDRVLGINDISDLKKIDLNIVNLLGGAASGIPLYAKLGPWAFSFGWITSLWGAAVTPTNFGPNDLRSSFDWWKDADYSGLYSDNDVMDDK